jgi:hypothetical protein
MKRGWFVGLVVLMFALAAGAAWAVGDPPTKRVCFDVLEQPTPSSELLSRPIRIDGKDPTVSGPGDKGGGGCGQSSCSISCPAGTCSAGPCASSAYAYCGCAEGGSAVCYCITCS